MAGAQRLFPLLATFVLGCPSGAEGEAGDANGDAATESEGDDALGGDDTADDDDDDNDDNDDNDEDDDTADDGGTDGGTPGQAVVVDANCIDGAYVSSPPEAFGGAQEPIDDLVAGFQPANARAFLEEAMARRYPTGAAILSMGGDSTDQWLARAPATAQGVLMFAGLIVHEVGHSIDRSAPDSWYYITAAEDGSDISFTVPGMHGPLTNSQSPRYAMERSRLLADDENAKRPPTSNSTLPTSAESGTGEFGTDSMFAQIYLSGDPDDGSFQSGDQGYNMLIEELVQYTNSLATRHHFSDFASGTSSDRHALLTWLWWNERYLRKIRMERPEEHAWLLANEAWMELILTTWGRAWLYISAEVPGIEPDTAQLHELVAQPHLLEEIQVIREAYGCTDPVEQLPQYAQP